MSTKANQYDHMIGNQYARKHERPANESLSLRCNFNDKQNWLQKSQSEGKSLNQWAIEKLNLSIDQVT